MRYDSIIFIIFRLSLLLLVFNANSQDLQKSRKKGYYTYIYSIDSKTASDIYAEKEWLNHSHLTNLMDSFLMDSSYKKKLAIGHYVYVSANLNSLKYSLKSISTVDAYILSNNKYILFYLFNKHNLNAITNAVVELNGRKALFDKALGLYKLKKTDEGFISVSFNNEQAFFSIEKEDQYKPKRKFIKNRGFFHKSKNNYSENKSGKGYIIFNKPKYLPKDTVKFKALILTKKNKYYNGDVEVKFGTRYEKLKAIKTLKPLSPGAYVYQFVLGDTLTINKNYFIELYDTKSGKKLIDGNDFELEDYQLNEASYFIKSDKELYSKGEPITFYASGKDANGFSILDGRVTIKAKIRSVEKYISDNLFMPNVLWSTSKNLDPLGETKIIIPDSIIPSADFTINIDATFNNSNNETHDTSFVISYMQTSEKLSVKLDSGFVKAEYLINGKSSPIQGSLYKELHGDDISEKILFPYKERINTNVIQYEFKAKNIYEELFSYDNTFSVNVYGIRTKDSVFINCINPHGLDITYSIYKGEKEIKKNTSKSIDETLKDESKDSYYINYLYTWQGESYNRIANIHLYAKKLNIKIEQPKDVYPGQNVPVKIKVTDYKNEPVENVNITAYSINSQFGKYFLPQTPYLGKHFKKKNNIDSYKLEALNHDEGTLNFNRQWRLKMGIDSMIYYKMLYPKNGINYNYDSVSSINAQISPFLVDSGQKIPIHIVYIDDAPVYYYGTDNSDQYVFITSDGFHSLRLRTKNKEYYIDSVLLKKGLKLDLAIDVNHLPKNAYAFKTTENLTPNERAVLRRSIVSINSNSDGENYLWQDNHVVVFNKKINAYNYSRLLNVGGFYPGKINFAVQDNLVQNFVFEPGYDYTIKNSVVKMVANDFLKAEVKLSTNINDQEMGLKATPLKQIKLKTPNKWHLDLINSRSNSSSEGNGTYKFEYTGDSTFCLIQAVKFGIDTTIKYYPSNQNSTLYNLEPGNYTITFITANKYYFKKDSVKIRENGIVFQRINEAINTNTISLITIDTTKKIVSNAIWESPKEIALFNPYSFLNLKESGAIKVVLKDKSNGETIPFANIVLYKEGVQVASGTTDMDGETTIKPLPPGRYNVKGVYVGYSAAEIRNVLVQDNRTSYLSLELSAGEGVRLDEVQIVSYLEPLIDGDMKSGGTVTREEFQNMATKNINAVAATTAGVFIADTADKFNVRGARASDEKNFVDGNLTSNNDGNKIRKDYSDYGYWQPNLITDKSGEVSFNVTFPDNVTKWNSYAIAMDDKKHTGNSYMETKAYKNTMANLAVPRFLIVGDSSIVIGKALNYSNKNIKLKTQFKINNQIVSNRDTAIQNSLIEKTIVAPINTDSLEISYSINLHDGLKDGEQRTVPVLQMGLEETKGMFAVLNRDTTFTISLDSGINEIYIQNNSIDFLLKELELLKKYPYWCMEQTASKLSALLMEEKISNYLNKEFKGEGDIRRLLSKLEKGQKSNGSWGWWEDSPENSWMTSYIVRILNEAFKMGYKVKSIDMGKQYLLWNLDNLKVNEKLFALNTLSELKVQVPYIELLNKLENDSMNLYQKLMILKIKQENKIPFDMQLILNSKKETVFNSLYWGEETINWYDNTINSTLLSYKIIEKNDSSNLMLQYIRNYFLEIKNQNKWRSTIETASILETILPAMLNNSENKLKPTTIILNGAINENVSKFPFNRTINKTDNKLTVTKTGTSPVFFTQYQKFWNKDPHKNETNYKIEFHFEVNEKKTDSINTGVPVDLVVEINAKKSAEYIMIDVPIPAGFSYDDNKFNVNYYEVHREYFKNRTSIFCQQLNQGKHIFKIKLQPRFSGSYNINPTKVELMYFPIFYGNNSKNKVKIN